MDLGVPERRQSVEKEADLNWPLPSREEDREGPALQGTPWESSLGVKNLDRKKVPCKDTIDPVDRELTSFGRGAFAAGSKLRVLRWGDFPGPSRGPNAVTRPYKERPALEDWTAWPQPRAPRSCQQLREAGEAPLPLGLMVWGALHTPRVWVLAFRTVIQYTFLLL